MENRHLQDSNKVAKVSPPPHPGMIFNLRTNRWHSPHPMGKGPGKRISAQYLKELSPKDLKAMAEEVSKLMRKERDAARFNDLTRVSGDIKKETRRRLVTKTLNKAARLAKRTAASQVTDGVEILLKGMSIESAIPVEQIKGDISRQGHIVRSVVALDPQARNLFFIDSRGNHLFAKFADFEHGFAVERIGFQKEIASEYDPVDLKPDDEEETVLTEHEEREYDETPGILPSATPGEKPDHDEQYYEDTGQLGEGLGDEGFGDEPRHEGRRDEVSKAIKALDKILR